MFDMKSGYHQLKVHPDSRKFFAMEVDGEILQFTVLPFGWNGSPYVFTQVMNQFVKMIESPYLHLSNYLDDIGLLHYGDYTQALRNLSLISLVCQELGIVMEKKKSVMKPMKKFQLLGIVIDLESKKVSMNTATILKIKNRINGILHKTHLGELISVKDLSSVAGIVIAFLDCFQPARVMLDLVHSLISRLVVSGGWDYYFKLKDSKVIHNLRWIIANLEFWNGKPFQYPSLVNYFWTDASKIGWGAYFKEKGLKLQGTWQNKEKEEHINILEARAIWLSLKEWTEHLSGKNLIIYTDSMVVLSVIKKGRAKSPVLNRIVQSIWRILFSNNIQLLSLEWLPSPQNVIADKISRKIALTVDPTDWEITQVAFNQVQQRFNRVRSFCIPLQFQSQTLLRENENIQIRHSRRVLPEVDRTSRELVLRSVQPSRQDFTTLYRVQSSNGSCSSSMERKMVVEINREISSRSLRVVWARFCPNNQWERGTLEEIMENSRNPDRRTIPELQRTLELIIPNQIRDSTEKNYNGYWTRFIDFAIKHNNTSNTKNGL